MKRLVLLLAILCVAYSAPAQEKPLTQQEYVRMLYALDNDFSGKDAIVSALRSRGISFVLTDGIRSLTRTKSRNDAELRRALEEADRRRRDPASATTLSPEDGKKIIEAARSRALEAVEQMPDFVVRQQIQRSEAFAGTGNFRNLDRLVVAVSYRSTGEEEYKLLSVNGILQNDPDPKRGYSEIGGTSSTGEFVTVLSKIFNPESQTRFRLVDTDTIRDRRAVMFDYEVDREKANQLITVHGTIRDSTVTGMRGRVWVDVENHRVLRIESDATEIPEDFPITAARRTIDYDWAEISGERFLLPSLSDVRLTQRDGGRMWETRNVIRFRDYQRYGTDVIIRDDDGEPFDDGP
jgi:hypothetical protein